VCICVCLCACGWVGRECTCAHACTLVQSFQQQLMGRSWEKFLAAAHHVHPPVQLELWVAPTLLQVVSVVLCNHSPGLDRGGDKGMSTFLLHGSPPIPCERCCYQHPHGQSRHALAACTMQTHLQADCHFLMACLERSYAGGLATLVPQVLHRPN